MNYRHSFHAGNFADVIKHAVLMRIMAYLQQKPGAIRVIDTHAGAGFYDLRGNDAARTGEWIDGIGRLARHRLPDAAEAVLAPYRAAIAALAPLGDSYPGSPALIRHALRETDRASFNELHPETCWHLRRGMGRDQRLVINELDGYLAWKAQVPPPERRGLVLVDPPFEKDDDFARLGEGLAMMARKWASGVAMLWYPIKNRKATDRLEEAAEQAGFARILAVELHVEATAAEGPLAACGLLIANPPYTLRDDMTALLPELSRLLARGAEAGWRAEWLVNN